jgi:hypothetical protein
MVAPFWPLVNCRSHRRRCQRFKLRKQDYDTHPIPWDRITGLTMRIKGRLDHGPALSKVPLHHDSVAN